MKGTRNKGTILRPDKTKGLEVYVDADFAGNWDPKEHQDRDTARSRHGYIIMYARCPILAKSQLQTEIALSSTESEYTGLSYALRETIPIMNLLNEMGEKGFSIISSKAQVRCKVFEDNSVRIIVDKKSFLYLVGTTLEYSGGLNGKGFVFNNPNAQRTCGCGESFSL